MDAVERRAMRLVQGKERTVLPTLDPLEHRRDMASLVVLQAQGSIIDTL